MRNQRDDDQAVSQKIHKEQVDRIRDLEAENSRLKDAVTILKMDKLILNEIVESSRQASAGS